VILTAEAFAKVNRGLRVISLRADGYHEIDTIFQTVDLTDSLEVMEGRGRLEVECDDPGVPSGPENLAWRAGALLAKRYGMAPSARIELRKRIPAGGGLGGGSADAAGVLVLLSRLWDVPAAGEDLFEIARELGSDVPFFLTGGRARGRGRGDEIEPLPDEEPREFVLVVPPFSVSTAAVYARRREAQAAAGKSETAEGTNDLARAAMEVEPRLARYRDSLRERYPDGEISGSGSCLFAPARDEADVGKLASAIPEARVRVVRTVGRAEYRSRAAVPN
jgi:4-diphosphocytidyl-2-C-methyl-D-erythritol kinase